MEEHSHFPAYNLPRRFGRTAVYGTRAKSNVPCMSVLRKYWCVVLGVLFLGFQGFMIWRRVCDSRMPKADLKEGNNKGVRLVDGSTAGGVSPDELVEERRQGAGLSSIAHVYKHPNLLLDGRKAVAFAVTITKDGYHMDGAAVLAASIDKACGSSEYFCDLVAFVHEDVKEALAVLHLLGFRVIKKPLPVMLEEIKDEVISKSLV
ncbi:unnamed protein product [Choristocarpus tenellus]